LPIASAPPVLRSPSSPVVAAAWLCVAFAAGAVLIAWASGAGAVRHGTWTGLRGSIAPDSGSFTLEDSGNGVGRCTVRGQDSISIGNGWVFRGHTQAREVACDVRIERDGALSGELSLRIAWQGRIKGIGGDWDDTEGFGVCTGPLVGSHDGVGAWQGACENEGHQWTTRFDWTFDSP
jgi:hypothetical protein